MIIEFIPQPPKKIDYPEYSQAEIDRRLLAVIEFVLNIPEERLKPKAEVANSPRAD